MPPPELQAEGPLAGALRQRPAVVGYFALLERLAELCLVAGLSDHGPGFNGEFGRHPQPAPGAFVIEAPDAVDDQALLDTLQRQTHPGGTGVVGIGDGGRAVADT